MSDQHSSTSGMLLDQLTGSSGLYVLDTYVKEDHVAFDEMPVGSVLVKTGSALPVDRDP
jgi:hypothetical protein